MSEIEGEGVTTAGARFVNKDKKAGNEKRSTE